jgi:RND family efflux transporter MFP subunit
MTMPAKTAEPDLGSLRIESHSRAGGKTGKRLGTFAAILGALVILGGLSAFLFKNQKVVVEVAAAQPASDARVGAVLNASGYVTPRRRATIAAKITGRTTAVYAEEGMRATAGQVLATLDDSDVRRAMDSAKADRETSAAQTADLEVQLRLAEIQLRRTQELQAAKVQSQEALDTARATADSLRAKIALVKQQVAGADARIAEAQQAVDNCTIRAPFSGMIVSKDAQVGEMVSPISAGGGFTRTGIATIVDMNSLEVEVDVNESYIARVQPGQKVISTLDAYPDWQIPSKVRTIIPTADRQKATVKVRISFDKLDPRILPDMGVKVAFLNEEPPKGKAKGPEAKALIPRAAVRNENGSSIVFLVRDGKLERRAVSLAGDRGSDVEVLAGITPGDTLVVRGPEMLREGQAVEIKQ